MSARFVLPVEVGRHSSLQILCLSYIYNSPFGIQILVNTGTFGKVGYNPFEVVVSSEFFHNTDVSPQITQINADFSLIKLCFVVDK